MDCISEADGDVVVEPGVRWEDLNDELKKRGIPLFFPVSWTRPARSRDRRKSGI